MENNEHSVATLYDLNRVDKRLSEEIHDVSTRVTVHGKDIERLKVLYESLQSLPTTFASLDKTLAIVGTNLESIQNQMTDLQNSVNEQSKQISRLQSSDTTQNEEIHRVDEKGKIDLIEVVKNNFWKIFAVVAAIYGVVQTFLNSAT